MDLSTKTEPMETMATGDDDDDQEDIFLVDMKQEGEAFLSSVRLGEISSELDKVTKERDDLNAELMKAHRENAELKLQADRSAKELVALNKKISDDNAKYLQFVKTTDAKAVTQRAAEMRARLDLEEKLQQLQQNKLKDAEQKSATAGAKEMVVEAVKKEKAELERRLEELQTNFKTAGEKHSKEVEQLRNEIQMEQDKSATQLEEKAKERKVDRQRIKELTATVKLLKQGSATQHEEKLELERKLNDIKNIVLGVLPASSLRQQNGPTPSHSNLDPGCTLGLNPGARSRWTKISSASSSSSSSSSSSEEEDDERTKLSETSLTCKNCAQRFPTRAALRRHVASGECRRRRANKKTAEENDSTDEDEDNDDDDEDNHQSKDKERGGQPKNRRANVRNATAKLKSGSGTGPHRHGVDSTKQLTCLCGKSYRYPAVFKKHVESARKGNCRPQPAVPTAKQHSMSTRARGGRMRTRGGQRFVDRNHQPHYLFKVVKKQHGGGGSSSSSTREAGRLQNHYYCKCGKDFDKESTVFDHILSIRLASTSK